MQIDNLEIIMKPVNEIIPYWRNPRRNDVTVDALVERIQKSGFNVPIVIDKNGVVVKGHARLRAAKRLGMERVPVVVSYASEDVIKADRIADNKIQELSSWDFGKLDMEIDRLPEMGMKYLFRPDETPVGDFEMPDVEYKPVGLDYGDSTPSDEFFSGGEHTDTAEAKMPPTGDFSGFTEAHEYSDVPGPGVPQGQDQPKRLKTLCPYCGKVVYLNV